MGGVWLSDEAKAEYDALRARTDKNGVQAARTIDRYFERFRELGPERGLDNDTQFKFEGRAKDGTGRDVAVFAFKAFQWRLYGVRRNVKGTRGFIGLCVDPKKKKDKADPALLAKCAQLASQIKEEE